MEKLLYEMIETLKRINKNPILEKQLKDEEFTSQGELVEECNLIEKNLLSRLTELKQSNLKDKYWINNQLNDIYRIFGGITENCDEIYRFIRKFNHQYCEKK